MRRITQSIQQQVSGRQLRHREGSTITHRISSSISPNPPTNGSAMTARLSSSRIRYLCEKVDGSTVPVVDTQTAVSLTSKQQTSPRTRRVGVSTCASSGQTLSHHRMLSRSDTVLVINDVVVRQQALGCSCLNTQTGA